ncbi:MAG: hypothetical protein GKR89_00995 [Candidatus Latescibacteria bacterium]|nr:hypothetical protein [Candidatus Latescibacterota bacterium]
MFQIFVVLLLGTAAWAQSEPSPDQHTPAADSLHVLTTLDGDTHIGRITSEQGDTLHFRTQYGDLSIPRAAIDRVETIAPDQPADRPYWFANPNTTRLYFAPTGRMLEQGSGYFADYYLFFPGFSYGISDRLSLGGGLSVLPGIDFDEQIFYLTPKLGLHQSKRFNLAVGALLVKIPVDDDPTVGVLYSVATFGKANNSLTAGLGYGFVDSDFSSRPMIVLGGEKRLSRRLGLVTENWLFPGVDEPLISYGVRFFGKDLSVDLSLLNVLGQEAIFPGIPYVDFVFNF